MDWGIDMSLFIKSHWDLIFPIIGICLFIWIKVSEKRKEPQPLEIIFDPKNPNKRFWSLENSPKPVHWEYRMEIQNLSNKTIRNARVTSALNGVSPKLPKQQQFDINKKETRDIHPGEKVLIPIFMWTEPKIQAGMLADGSVYGPLQVTVNADDTKTITKFFYVNYQTDQMLLVKK